MRNDSPVSLVMRALFVLVAVVAAGNAVPALAAERAPEAVQPAAAAPRTVAGRTLKEWTQELSSKHRIVRLRAARTLPVFGAPAVPALSGALGSDDPAIVYWAAYGLGDIARPAPKALPHLKRLLKSKSEALRISAAYAMCRLGHVKLALPVLTAGLKSPHRGTANSAADFLARIGPPARAALPALKEAAGHRDYHVKNAANEAIRRITAKADATR